MVIVLYALVITALSGRYGLSAGKKKKKGNCLGHASGLQKILTFRPLCEPIEKMFTQFFYGHAEGERS